MPKHAVDKKRFFQYSPANKWLAGKDDAPAVVDSDGQDDLIQKIYSATHRSTNRHLVEKLEARLREKNQEIELLEERAKLLQQSLDKNGVATDTLNKLIADKSNLSQQVQAFKDSLDSKQRDCDDISKQLEESIEKLTSATQTVAEYRSEIQSLTTDNEALHNTIKQRDEAITTQNIQITTLGQELTSLTTDNEALHNTIKQRDEAITAQNNQITTLGQELEVVRAHLNDFVMHFTHLRDKLREYRLITGPNDNFKLIDRSEFTVHTHTGGDGAAEGVVDDASDSDGAVMLPGEAEITVGGDEGVGDEGEITVGGSEAVGDEGEDTVGGAEAVGDEGEDTVGGGEAVPEGEDTAGGGEGDEGEDTVGGGEVDEGEDTGGVGEAGGGEAGDVVVSPDTDSGDATIPPPSAETGAAGGDAGMAAVDSPITLDLKDKITRFVSNAQTAYEQSFRRILAANLHMTNKDIINQQEKWIRSNINNLKTIQRMVSKHQDENNIFRYIFTLFKNHETITEMPKQPPSNQLKNSTQQKKYLAILKIHGESILAFWQRLQENITPPIVSTPFPTHAVHSALAALYLGQYQSATSFIRNSNYNTSLNNALTANPYCYPLPSHPQPQLLAAYPHYLPPRQEALATAGYPVLTRAGSRFPF